MCIVVHVSVRDAVLAKLARVGTTQTHFNEAATGQAYGSYEERRWGANDRVKAQQEQATSFLSHRVLNLLPTTGIVMELGPGPGTWTRLIAEHAPKVKFILIDIAKEMLERAQQAIGEERVLEAIETDFTYAAPAPASVDFFFSSRAIEYVPDKYKGVQTIATALKKGGAGCVITKMPKPLMNRLSGREQSTLHSGQISPRSLRSAFVAAGLTITHIYPVTFAVPLLRSAVLDRVVGKVFSAVPLNPFSALFAESYAVIFHKP